MNLEKEETDKGFLLFLFISENEEMFLIIEDKSIFLKTNERYGLMYNYVLNSVRLLTIEIKRLKGLADQMKKSNDNQKKKEYEDFIKGCKEEKNKLLKQYCPEKIIESLHLSDDEKTMAEFYYLKGTTWEEAFYETDEFINIDGDEFDEAITKKIKKVCRTHQRNIERKVHVFYSFNKKKELS